MYVSLFGFVGLLLYIYDSIFLLKPDCSVIVVLQAFSLFINRYLDLYFVSAMRIKDLMDRCPMFCARPMLGLLFGRTLTMLTVAFTAGSVNLKLPRPYMV